MKTFYKSVDIAQLLYVHPKREDLAAIEDLGYYIKNIMPEYNPILEDPEFVEELHDRTLYKKKAEREKKEENSNKILLNYDIMQDPRKNFLLRDGLTPATKNVQNVRYKADVKEVAVDVEFIEGYLKDNIDYGFSENAVEELLYFDEKGNLVNREGVPEFEKADSVGYSSLYD
mmetsp:Transcript_5785/g.6537  ORF Transcript_5785/g.6537 Transcript_5785/m.6537 type:complete len:173 (-) Transcript_5785:33-551(-)